jgi:hypothetical protein
MFPLGLSGTLAGVYLLSARSMRRTISRQRMQDGMPSARFICAHQTRQLIDLISHNIINYRSLSK